MQTIEIVANLEAQCAFSGPVAVRGIALALQRVVIIGLSAAKAKG